VVGVGLRFSLCFRATDCERSQASLTLSTHSTSQASVPSSVTRVSVSPRSIYLFDLIFFPSQVESIRENGYPVSAREGEAATSKQADMSFAEDLLFLSRQTRLPRQPKKLQHKVGQLSGGSEPFAEAKGADAGC